MPLSPIYAFTPHGTQFAQPVTVRVPFDPASAPSNVTIVLLQAEPGGAFKPIPAQVEPGAMTATVSSFSYFGVARVGQITAGYEVSCALVRAGLQCWGAGQLGNGTTTGSTTPVYVTQAGSASGPIVMTTLGSIATNNPSCAQTGGHSGAMCWAPNVVPNATHTSTVPVLVPGLNAAYALTAGWNHACALQSGGAVACWGDNSQGQLGDGTTTFASTPVLVTGLSGVTGISANLATSCAVLANSTVKCWGRNDWGQLGDGSLGGTGVHSASPVAVRGLTNVASIAVGGYHTCALLTDGTARCWGQGDSGQLGDGSMTTSSTPVTVSGLTGAIALSAGYDTTCALLSQASSPPAPGTAVCWGNYAGSLRGVPVNVVGLTDAAEISVGFDHQCAMRTDGTALCWGYNDKGQLGNGSTWNSAIPVEVLLGDPVPPGSDGGSGVNGNCSNLSFTQGATTSDCTVSEQDGTATLAMICSASSCQCFVNSVPYGPVFGNGAICGNAASAFTQMTGQCGCP
jgi:alpha-tubulin suppressor-like RCC1 family protein